MNGKRMRNYTVRYTNGPVFRDLSLIDAKALVERYTSLKRGWTGTWERSACTPPGEPTHVHHIYTVRNSKGKFVQFVNVTPEGTDK